MKHVLITAGAAGIGAAMARGFMDAGAKVAVCDVDDRALAQFSKACPGAVCKRADVTVERDMDEFFEAAESNWGASPDVVCANAGTGGPAGGIEDLDFTDWQACLAVNVHGAFLTARRAVPGMKRLGHGLILFTASTAGLMGYPYRTPYASAKWAVVGLTKSLAMELGPHGIRVNALCPGSVRGARMDRVIENEAKVRGVPAAVVRKRYVQGISMGVWIEPEEIAAMAVYLASSEGSSISGQAITIDGHTQTLSLS